MQFEHFYLLMQSEHFNCEMEDILGIKQTELRKLQEITDWISCSYFILYA